MTDGESPFGQLVGQGASRFSRPPQRAFGIPTTVGLHQEPVFKLLTFLFNFFRRLLHGVVPVAVKFVPDEGKQHPDRDAQFHYLNDQVSAFLAAGLPVISVDTKKNGSPGTDVGLILR